MVHLCCICKLQAGAIADVSFHKIPKQEDIKLQWFKKIGREVKKYATVCSKHFKEEDFHYTGINYIKRRMLLPGAIPSLLLTPPNSNDCMPPPIVNNKPCTINSTTIEVDQRNQCLTVINSNVTNTILHASESVIHRTENNPLNVSEKENCSNYDFSKNSGECGINDSPFSVNSTEDTPQSILKRKADEPNVKAKRLCNFRYIGDLRREDFTSDASWKVVNNFVKESRKKQGTLQKRVNRLLKKVNNLQGLLYHLEESGLNHEAKRSQHETKRIRHFHTKLVLFKNQ